MTINFALIIRDHADNTLRELDDEIARMTARLAQLHRERMQVVAHATLNDALNLDIASEDKEAERK